MQKSVYLLAILTIALVSAGCAASSSAASETSGEGVESTAAGDSRTVEVSPAAIAPDELSRHVPDTLENGFERYSYKARYELGVATASAAYRHPEDSDKHVFLKIVGASTPEERYRGGIRFTRGSKRYATEKSRDYQGAVVFELEKAESWGNNMLVAFVRPDVTVQVSSGALPVDELYRVLDAVDVKRLAGLSKAKGDLILKEIYSDADSLAKFAPSRLQGFERIEMETRSDDGFPFAEAVFSNGEDKRISLVILGKSNQPGFLMNWMETELADGGGEKKSLGSMTVYEYVDKSGVRLKVPLSNYTQLVTLEASAAVSVDTLYAALGELDLEALEGFAPELPDKLRYRARISDTDIEVTHPKEWFLLELDRQYSGVPHSVLVTRRPLAVEELYKSDSMKLGGHAFLTVSVLKEQADTDLEKLLEKSEFGEKLPLENVRLRSEPQSVTISGTKGVVAVFEGTDSEGLAVTSRQMLLQDAGALIHVQTVFSGKKASEQRAALEDIVSSVRVLAREKDSASASF